MNTEEYIELISREPLPPMIEEGKGYRYIKKSVLKKELLKIFKGHTKFEIVDKVVTKNGLYGSGLFHYKHPVSGEWLFESGMAAIPHDKSMRLNYPTLKAQIFKNAVREIGVWFGQTLNLDTDDAEPEEEIPEINIEDERMEKVIDNCTTPEQLAKLKSKLTPATKGFYVLKLAELTKNISNELGNY